MKKFDIVVFDGMKHRQDNGVMAKNINELSQIYAMTDEKIVQVLREYEDEDCKNYGKFDPNEILKNMNTPMAKGTLAPGSGMMRVSDEMQKMIDNSIANSPNKNETQTDGGPPNTTPPVPGSFDGLIQNGRRQPAKKSSSEPVFFKVGDVYCKIDGGVVYQKRWCPASESDMKKIRVVVDKTGKDLPMSGKHIELLKWQIADSEPDSDPIECDCGDPEDDQV